MVGGLDASRSAGSVGRIAGKNGIRPMGVHNTSAHGEQGTPNRPKPDPRYMVEQSVITKNYNGIESC